MNRLVKQGVEVTEDTGSGMLWTLLISLGPVILIFVLFFFMMRRMRGSSNQAFQFGKSKARLINRAKNRTTFDDVAGCDEAKEELNEVIGFLRNPKKFQKLGGKIPHGILLVGPPGTGKTLLAKAVAGEANVPFFSISGSDFVEMFVGVGASRVRDLFNTGKRNAPCIIFVDELDAVGRQRGAGLGGGHDEREQTLNQLLIEMDGFETNESVILMAATNRPDVLDPALLRPGRFDRQVIVDMPDLDGRYEILKVHAREKPMGDDVDLKKIARSTPFFSGADLANLINESAILAARYDLSEITQEVMEEARDKVMLGPERRSRKLDEEDKRVVAYHEAGHALVAALLPDFDPVHKVTIVPRGRALGLTMPLPEKERVNYDAAYLEKRLAMLMGGRAAEELALKVGTSGAANDIEKASELARKMVTRWGMSERLGPLTFGEQSEEIFLGREISQHRDYSEKTAQLIDDEVRRIVEEAHGTATRLLEEHRETLETLARILIERETIDGEELKMLLRGEALPADDRELPSLREEYLRERDKEREERLKKDEPVAVWPGDEGETAPEPPLGYSPAHEQGDDEDD
ncbi:MAG: ATP-dependent zinc metalloprotease FtsH [Candidatus Coatesbacteria bacterium]|nr:ATP-dependent zinc metalloprotease FtsH [Candidatus Coatesbacteria bacterium]